MGGACSRACTSGARFADWGIGPCRGATGEPENIALRAGCAQDGALLTGTYTPTTNTFLGGSPVTVGNTTYSLTEFSYRRFLGDAVQANVATPGGDGNDYVGNIRFNAVAGVVPEPATWAMMIGGIGFAGGSLRARRTRTKVSYAA